MSACTYRLTDKNLANNQSYIQILENKSVINPHQF